MDTIEDIYNDIIAEKESMPTLNGLQPSMDSAQTLLSDLKSTSIVSKWRLHFWVIATAMFAQRVLFEAFKIEQRAVLDASKYGQEPWYVVLAKSFQYGDSIVMDRLTWKYDVIDESKQIVKLAAATSAEGILNLKIAKLSGSIPAPLNTFELAAFKSFISKTQPPTVKVNVINDNPDQLKLYLSAIIDPLKLTSAGESILNPGTFPLEDAINAYLENFGSQSGFNGAFDTMESVLAGRAAEGIISLYFVSAQARYGSNPYASFTQRYTPNAGYMVIDPAFPLSSTITYNV